jgi:ribosomal protein S18 acetylase RimI-like enzyme
MQITFSHQISGVDRDALLQLFTRNQMGGRSRDKLYRAFENSYAVCFAFHENNLVGAGRAISDGEYHAGIYDVAVLPEYQGQGIGREIMGRLLSRLKVWRIVLVADGDNQDFYRKLGFENFENVMAKFNPQFLIDIPLQTGN